MRWMDQLMGLGVWLVSWVPFAACQAAFLLEYTGRHQHRRRWIALALPAAASSCIWAAAAHFTQKSLLFPALLLALQAFCMPFFARFTRQGVNYTAYCLSAGSSLGIALYATALDGLSSDILQGGAVLLMLLSVCAGWSGLCVFSLRRLVFPYQEQLNTVRRFPIDFSSVLYLGLVLFFYYGGVVLFSRPLTILSKHLSYVLCMLGTWDTYRRNARLMDAVSKLSSQRQRSEMLSLGLQIQQTQYRALEEQIGIARALRHDLRHHQLLIRQYVNNGDREGLSEYIAEFQRQQELFGDEPAICAHPVANALARYYLGRMRGEGIRLDVRMEIGERCAVLGPDLCVVLGNLLENALDALRKAAQEQKYFRIRAAEDGEMLTIVAENGYSGERRRTAAGSFLSTKQKGGGFGLNGIRAIVEKYHGDLKAEAENGVFRISLLLFEKGAAV